MEYVERSGGKIIIRLGDSLNSKIATAILNEIKPHISPEIKRVDVYCDKLKHTSEDGICVLRHIKWEVNTDMVLHNVAESIKDILSLTLMDGYFLYED